MKKVRDMLKRDVSVGNIITYPVRSAGDMWMSFGVYRGKNQVGEDVVEVPVEKEYNPNTRKYKFSSCLCSFRSWDRATIVDSNNLPKTPFFRKLKQLSA